MKERARTSIKQDSFRFVKIFFTKTKSNSFKVSKTGSLLYTENNSAPLPQPDHQLDDSPPKLRKAEVAPGPEFHTSCIKSP